MKLQVGILGDRGGYTTILLQEKIPFVTIDRPESLYDCSALVVGDDVDQSMIDETRDYLAHGGSVLCSGTVFHHLTAQDVYPQYVRSVFGNSDVFSNIDVIGVYRDCMIPEMSNVLMTNHRRPAAYVENFGDGMIIALPFDPGTVLLDDRSKAKSFYSQNNRLPHEHVSSVGKGGIRRLVVRSLELLHHARGLPYVHLSYFPSGARSVFGIRIDTDFANEQEIEGVYRCAEKCGIPFTWFLHVASHENFLERFKEMNGHEIGLHCYNHIYYEGKNDIMHDIEHALDLCRKAGIDPQSYVAPYGQWNNDVQHAIDYFHLEYSSEFSYDYDNLPSFPVVDGVTATTLQVPVHPIGIGSLRRQGYTTDEMKKYVDRVFDWNVQTQTPMFWYHHPKNHHEDVLEYIIHRAQSEQLPVLKMIDYARWWKKRHDVRFVFEVSGATLRIDHSDVPEDVFIHITTKDAKECYVPMANTIDLRAMQWKDIMPATHLPDDFRRVGKFNPRIPLNYIENKLVQILFPKS